MHGTWHGAWCWEERFLPWFRDHGYDARALTLRRHDQRHAPGLRLTRIRDYVADVAAAAAEMPRPPVVVGHSMGGFITQKYLEEHPAPAAVLVASIPPTGALKATLAIAARHPLRLLAVNLTWSSYRLVSTPARAREVLFGPGLPEEEVARYQAMMTDDAYLAYLEMLFFVRPDREKVRRTPILAVGAELDWLIPRKDVEATAKAYGAEVEQFAGQSHDLMLEPAWERVAERIDRFLKEKVPGA